MRDMGHLAVFHPRGIEFARMHACRLQANLLVAAIQPYTLYPHPLSLSLSLSITPQMDLNVNEHSTMLNRTRAAPTAAANVAVCVFPCPISVKNGSFADHVWPT